MSQARVARDLGITPGVMGNWKRELAEAVELTDPSAVGPGADAAEIQRLRKEVARLKEERDILKKAAAYFAKESQ